MGGSGLDRTDDFQKPCGSGLDRIQFYRIRTGLGLKNFAVRSSLTSMSQVSNVSNLLARKINIQNASVSQIRGEFVYCLITAFETKLLYTKLPNVPN